MFAVLYRFYLKPDREDEYRQCWRLVATYFKEQRGALGSCLQKGDDGIWYVYSRWPDLATRDASWPGDDAPPEVLPEAVKQAIVQMKDCADQEKKLDDVVMDVVEDGLCICSVR